MQSREGWLEGRVDGRTSMSAVERRSRSKRRKKELSKVDGGGGGRRSRSMDERQRRLAATMGEGQFDGGEMGWRIACRRRKRWMVVEGDQRKELRGRRK